MSQPLGRIQLVKRAVSTRDENFVRGLLSDEPIVEAIARTINKRRNIERDDGWQRTAGSLDRNGDSASLVYARRGSPLETVLVRAFSNHCTTKHRREDQDGMVQTDFGVLHVQSFLEDSSLLTLRSVFERYPRVEILRYRPGRRCTFRVHGENTQDRAARVQADGTNLPTDLVAKVFPDGRGWSVVAAGAAIHNTATRGQLDFDVARILGWNSNLNLLSQSVVAGRPIVDRLLSQDGPTLAARMGGALASIPRSNLRVRARLDGPDQLERSRRYLRNLRTLLPDLAGEIDDLENSLRNAHVFHPRVEPVAIHGSPHAHQWLESGDRLGLIDFDRVSMGDPELDVATFLTEMAYEDPSVVPIEAICQSFQDAYASAYPLESDRLWTYCAHKHLSKALKGARSLRIDGAQRATTSVERARAALRRSRSD